MDIKVIPTVEIKARTSKHIPLFYVDVIIYPRLNPDSGLTNLDG